MDFFVVQNLFVISYGYVLINGKHIFSVFDAQPIAKCTFFCTSNKCPILNRQKFAKLKSSQTLEAFEKSLHLQLKTSLNRKVCRVQIMDYLKNHWNSFLVAILLCDEMKHVVHLSSMYRPHNLETIKVGNMIFGMILERESTHFFFNLGPTIRLFKSFAIYINASLYKYVDSFSF